MLADVIVLKRDPVADIAVLQGSHHLAWVIKDGRPVDLARVPAEPEPLVLNAAG